MHRDYVPDHPVKETSSSSHEVHQVHQKLSPTAKSTPPQCLLTWPTDNSYGPAPVTHLNVFCVFTSNMTSNTRVPSKSDKIRWEWSLLAEEHRMALTLDRQLTGARGLAIWSSSPLMSFIYFFCIFAPWHVLFEDFPRDWFYYYFIKENASTLKLEATSAPVPCRTTNQTSCRSLMPERRFMRSQLAHLQHQHRKNAAQPW